MMDRFIFKWRDEGGNLRVGTPTAEETTRWAEERFREEVERALRDGSDGPTLEAILIDVLAERW